MLCRPCQESLSELPAERLCQRCAMPAPLANLRQPAQRCPSCQHRRFRFQAALAWGPYRGPLRDVIRRLKLGGQEALAMAMGDLLAQAVVQRWSAEPPDWIAPMPMHWRRRLRRGFPLSEMFASSVGRHLGWPVRRRGLTCRRATRKQGTLSPQQRQRNVQGAFRASAVFRGADVLLIDDVLTSGATASAAADALLSAGATRVRVAVLARALGGSPSPSFLVQPNVTDH